VETAFNSMEELEPPHAGTCSLLSCPSVVSDEEVPKNAKLVSLKRPPRFCAGKKSKTFRKTFFPLVRDVEWYDWRWQISHRIKTRDDLERIIALGEKESMALQQTRALPMGITPYYASLLDPHDDGQPIRRSVVPTVAEQLFSPGEEADPLHEDHDSPVPGLIHRYPDRVLFLVTDFCSTYCRYCTRSRMVGTGTMQRNDRSNWEAALAYIEQTPAVRDVLLSGGDPLTLADDTLAWILGRLRKIKHVELIRIGTKIPVVLPYRVTPALTKMLRRYHPLWMSIHVTHPDELTPEMGQACERLADAGIPLGSQTVLLAGINDTVETMKALFQGLLRIRVKPYYLYQCDPIVGSAHFRTPVAGAGDHSRAQGAYVRVCSAALCDRCAGRRRKNPTASPVLCRA